METLQLENENPSARKTHASSAVHKPKCKHFSGHKEEGKYSWKRIVNKPSSTKRKIPWGRHNNASWKDARNAMLMMSLIPFVPTVILRCCIFDNAELSSTLWAFYEEGPSILFSTAVSPTWRAFGIYSIWLLFQLFLFMTLPGEKHIGQPTPAGFTLEYTVNGLKAFMISHAIFFMGGHWEFFPMTIVVDEWLPLCMVLNIAGFFWTLVAYTKALYFPSHTEDCKFSGSILYDIFMGIELNPRIQNLDLKLFFNGRPGIIGWSIIDISFAAKMHEIYGYVPNSMIALILLHECYILDFFMYEDWYIRTMDMTHDHFGFYFAWGDTVWLPIMYSMQSLYLLFNPIELPWHTFLCILTLGGIGYTIFRLANNEKYFARNSNGQCMIWGEPATYIRAKYHTNNGACESLLLTSGCWGVARHVNYVGDLTLALAMCLTCGVDHILPYFYFIYMSMILIHRCGRDHERCSGKYGDAWDQYCSLVPWRFIPYIW